MVYGAMFFHGRMVIQTCLRERMLEIFHKAHQGVFSRDSDGSRTGVPVTIYIGQIYLVVEFILNFYWMRSYMLCSLSSSPSKSTPSTPTLCMV